MAGRFRRYWDERRETLPSAERATAILGLQCVRCRRWHGVDMRILICPCGGPLWVRYDLGAVVRSASPRAWAERPPGMWRYHDLLPLGTRVPPVSLGEGGSPLLTARRTGERLGLDRLYVKDEGLQPTLTFKARGASLGVSMAKLLGYGDVGLATTGSAGTAWAAYCARAGLALHLAVPADTPAEVAAEAEALGADVRRVPGTIVEAAALMQELARAGGWYDADAFREPFRLEGKKTLAFEVAESLGWRLPSALVFPTGGGIGPLGAAKGFDELLALGWIAPPPPRIVLVQAAGCAPIVRAFADGRSRAAPWPAARTIAKGIRVPETPADVLLLDLLARTGGTAVAVSDGEIAAAQDTVRREEGLAVGLEGAAGFAALTPLVAGGWLRSSDTVVVVNTGSGLKPGAGLAGPRPRVAAVPRRAAGTHERNREDGT